MLKNYFKTAFRNLYKHKGYFFINVIGLAIGLTSFIFISLYVIHELSFDRFHDNHERIYRLKVKGQMSGQELDQAITAAPMAAALKKDFPEVENVVRLNRSGAWKMRYKEKIFNEDGLLFADSSFFDIFSFKLLKGDKDKALVHPRSIVMTESFARKYFGDEDPMGKLINVERDTVFYKVTGIMEDVPANSHIHFDMMASINTLRSASRQNWVSHNFYTYIRLKEGTDPEAFEKKMQTLITTYVGPQIKQILGFTLEDFKNMGNFFGYHMQALGDIHLYSSLQYEIGPNGNIAYVRIFSIIAILILFIAIINFVNLATAKSSARSKEVGIRKTIGASKTSLINQFLGESLLLTFISMLVAIFLVNILTPNFYHLLGIELAYTLFNNYIGIPLLVILMIVVGTLAGIYPSFVLASFKPIFVLKGNASKGAKSGLFRSILVVSQFLISISIIIGTMVVYKQLSFMQNKDLGFDKEDLLVIRRSDALRTQLPSFKAELLKKSNIKSVGNAIAIPGKKSYNNTAFFKEDDPNKNTYLLWQNRVSMDYPETMGFKLKLGRLFDRKFGTDSSAVIINEAAVKVLGYTDDNILSKKLSYPTGNNTFTSLPIVGVVKDFHFESLHKKVDPVVFTVMSGNREGYFCVRIKGGNLKETVDYIEKLWYTYSNDMPFNYFFFKEDYNNLYKSETKTGNILSIFSILAIVIASLGLVGLITYTTAVKTKEIGIRKVHGASVGTIVRLLSSEVIKLVLISSIIAWPLAYFGIDYWLNSFAHRTSIGIEVYMAGTLITLVIGWAAISYQTIKVALSNPVDALRYE